MKDVFGYECPACGTLNATDVEHCTNCGRWLRDPDPARKPRPVTKEEYFGTGRAQNRKPAPGMNSYNVLAYLSIIVLLFIAWSVYSQSNKPVLSLTDSSAIAVADDPVQTPYSGDDIVKKAKGDEFTLTPVAKYDMAAVVESKKRYYFDWNSEIAPMDLVLAWGDAAAPGYAKYIQYSQSGRWYFFQYTRDCPLSAAYLVSHSSNNHIIPADDNVYKAVKSLGIKQTVYLEGYLVNIQARVNGNDYTWDTSLSRTDTGDGACEVFYVNKVQIADRVYE